MAISFKLSRVMDAEQLGTPYVSDDIIDPFVEYEIRARTVRLEMFDSHIVNDATWPLMQELFSAHIDGVSMRTKELCASSALPQTTVLRYLDHLEKFEVVRRESDAEDHRVTLVSLTGVGAFWMRQYYSRVIWSERRLTKIGEGILSLHRKLQDQFGDI